MSTKPSPYVTFESYNGQKNESQMIQQQKPQQQQMNQQQMNQQQMNQQQMNQQQMNQQQMNQQQMNQPSRFKHVQSCEHLYNILTTGLDYFQNNFKSKQMNPPPMKIFLKLYTEWCGPCKTISPYIEQLSLLPENQNTIFLKFDADLMIKGTCKISKELTKILKIGAVPAFFGIIDGNIIGNAMGADKKEINELLQKLQ
jgi:thiol-disulfide isomerase/thioredoxin